MIKPGIWRTYAACCLWALGVGCVPAGTEGDGSSEGTDRCPVPQAPTLSVIHAGATLEFSTESPAEISVGLGEDTAARSPESWLDRASVTLPADPAPRALGVFARGVVPSCPTEDQFAFVYEIRSTYPAGASEPGSTAVAMDDSRITAWATDWIEPVSYGADLAEGWMHPERATGPAQGTSLDVVALGRGGQIILMFDVLLTDGPGPDLAIFENGFSGSFLELAWVEVSSDGETFVRFDGVSLTAEAVSAFGTIDTARVGGLAGKYAQGYGTPFDLSLLSNRPEVRRGEVDLESVRFVRIVDIVGDGSEIDSFGNPVFDPYPTTGSAGFDLDAVAVLNSRDE